MKTIIRNERNAVIYFVNKIIVQSKVLVVTIQQLKQQRNYKQNHNENIKLNSSKVYIQDFETIT